MRELAVLGFIAIVSGALSYGATRGATQELGWFHLLNLGGGALALLLAAVLGLGRLRSAAQPGLRAVLGRGLLGVLLAVAAAVALERAAHHSGIEFDWTLEGRYELSEATLRGLEEIPGPVRAVLYYDPEDPRIRSTRLLLRALAGTGRVRVSERVLEESPADADRYEIGSSNSVVVLVGEPGTPGERFETVARPTEGSFYEALYRLRSLDSGLLYVARGSGEGDIERNDPTGFSGLAQALLTEGYRIRGFVPAQGAPIPADVDAVIWIAPRRPLPEPGRAALEGYLAGGGRLVAFLEPGASSGLEEMLAGWGLRSPDALLVDPASGRVDGDAPGVNPLAHHYGGHPIAHGLDAGRMTFFRGARSFQLRKPRPDDDLWAVVLASPRSWLAEDPAVRRARGGRTPVRPAEARQDYHPLVVAGRYERPGGQTRIVAFGDADFASNRNLRTLYNLDLALNAVHWAASREPAIKLLPKVGVSGASQFALPIQNTLTRFYGVGLLLPELLLMFGAVMWLRTRSA